MRERSTLFYGSKGIDLLSPALEWASELLDTSVCTLDKHPNFLLIQNEDRTIKVDEIKPIFECAISIPIHNYYVVIIDGMDRLTVQAGNKLLKILEEKEDLIIIGLCYGGPVLDTLKSRMSSKTFYGKSDLTNDCGMDADILCMAVRNREGLLKYAQENLALLKSVREYVQKEKEIMLFELLHLWKEKDPDSVFEKKELCLLIFNVLEATYVTMLESSYDDRIYQNIVEVNKHRKSFESQSYTKNDFFCLFAKLKKEV